MAKIQSNAFRTAIVTNVIIQTLIRTWNVIDGCVNEIDTRFHEMRKPVTGLFSRFFMIFHMDNTHVTALRLVMIVAFLPIWISGHQNIAVILLAINVFLDMVDGDMARFQQKDSDVRKFEDITVDNILIVVIPLALIFSDLVPAILGAYYIFITTFSWWLSVMRRNLKQKSNWIFRAQASSFLFFMRFFVIILLVFLYALFEIEVFSTTVLVLSIILTLNTAFDYHQLVKSKLNSSE